MKKQLHPVLQYGGILLASLLYAAAIALFLDPNHLASYCKFQGKLRHIFLYF